MAISTVAVGNTNTTIYTSTNTSAVTMLSLCNYSASAVTISIHVVPSGNPGTGNIVIKDVSIPAGDTYMLYSAGEKLVLDNGNYINAIASAISSVTAVVSYTGI